MDALAEIRNIYFDECDEFIGLLEGHLAAIGEGRATPDDIHGAFRAVHSIKGGAGAFALTELVEFAHMFEACLDALRSGRVAIDEAPIDMLLQAGDVLSELISAARDGRSVPVAPALVAALQAMAGGQKTHAPKAGDEIRLDDEPAPAPAAAASPAPAAAEASAGRARKVTIHLNPEREFFRRAIDPRMIFDALRHLGDLEVTCDTAQVPLIASLDPMDCWMRWTIELQTEHGPEHIVEALESFLADEEFTINDASQAAEEAPAPAAAPEAAAAPASPTAEAKPAAEAAAEPATPAAPAAAAAPAAPAPAQRRTSGGTIRVDLERIDRLMNLVGEIVITQSMLSERAGVLAKREAASFVDALFSLARQTRELQDNVMAVRAQPVKVVFQRLPRLVRELERTLGKKAHLVLAGEDTEVDKTIVEELADPLIHMLRNSMDHGLEPPEERIAAGKPADGTIRVSAEHRGSRILICVTDDGRGINREKLVAKAKARGLLAPDAEPSPEEADNLIFHPGLSTAQQVTDVSGRGVGMDVVRRNVEALGGRITVESTPGRGCKFTLGLPLTLAVLDGMIVRAGTERFVFPLSSIVETMQLDPASVEPLPGGRDILQLRGEIAPLLKLRQLLGIRAIGDEPIVVIVETETVPRLAIAVDEIVGQQQVVVKNLESSFRRVEGVSAATILGDGLVALILDVDALPALSQSGRKLPTMADHLGVAV
ncbi:chemotaxis protein CheA [Alsobacter soli]|uniref:Chemotaxis protein CheA n=1 Tax=Alsobacter soli TaxID=2109933 RepID=A0A2T1HQP4_9HYPH|nr:chemotaxis protein CheA [Alsobacter soli]PSC03970.1 chemotaxis protein CheA [Alsobacter soli]